MHKRSCYFSCIPNGCLATEHLTTTRKWQTMPLVEFRKWRPFSADMRNELPAPRTLILAADNRGRVGGEASLCSLLHIVCCIVSAVLSTAIIGQACWWWEFSIRHFPQKMLHSEGLPWLVLATAVRRQVGRLWKSSIRPFQQNIPHR